MNTKYRTGVLARKEQRKQVLARIALRAAEADVRAGGSGKVLDSAFLRAARSLSRKRKLGLASAMRAVAAEKPNLHRLHVELERTRGALKRA